MSAEYCWDGTPCLLTSHGVRRRAPHALSSQARFERDPTILKPQSKDADRNDKEQGRTDRVLLEGRAEPCDCHWRALELGPNMLPCWSSRSFASSEWPSYVRCMHLPFACSSALTWVQSGFSSRTRPAFDEHPYRTAMNSAATMADLILSRSFGESCPIWIHGS